MAHQKENGIKAEYHFIAILNRIGIPYEYIDSWFDFEVLGKKIEIKSCQITIKNGKIRRSIGRFDFTDKENRELQHKNNIWVCFILRYREQFMILGLCRARKLDKKRYITLHKLRDLNLMDLEEWIQKQN